MIKFGDVLSDHLFTNLAYSNLIISLYSQAFCYFSFCRKSSFIGFQIIISKNWSFGSNWSFSSKSKSKTKARPHDLNMHTKIRKVHVPPSFHEGEKVLEVYIEIFEVYTKVFEVYTKILEVHTLGQF